MTSDSLPTGPQAAVLRYAMGGPSASQDKGQDRAVVRRCIEVGWLRPDGHLQYPEGREALRRFDTVHRLHHVTGKPLPQEDQ